MTDSLFNAPLQRVEAIQLQLSHLDTLCDLIANQVDDNGANNQGLALLLLDLSKHMDGTLSSLQSWLIDTDAAYTLTKNAGHD